MSKYTVFSDMYSGGSCKLKPYEKIYIQGSEEDAVEIFNDKFNIDPYNVTCYCCGADYDILEYNTLDQATSHDRDEQSIEEYLKEPHVLVVKNE